MLPRSLILLLSLALSLPAQADWFSVEPRFAPEKRRNYSWSPLLSLILPSFDQWWERQHEAAILYTLVAGGGLTLAGQAGEQIDQQEYKGRNLGEYRNLERQYTYGLQLYLFAGEMSAYHSFRTAVASRKAHGEFTFLKAEETPADLLLAPFEIEHVIKPTVYIPLLLLAGLGVATIQNGSTNRTYFTWNDAAFTGGVSYNAGVGEEAFFRGYLMPVLHERLFNAFWSNAATAAIFGAAHMSQSNRYPLIQTGAGLYLGWLTQRNGWSLRESIFLHTWWDVLAVGIQIAAQNKEELVIPLPKLSWEF